MGKTKSIQWPKMKENEQRNQQRRLLLDCEDRSKPLTRSRSRAAENDGGGDIHQRERWLKLESLEIYQRFPSHRGSSKEVTQIMSSCERGKGNEEMTSSPRLVSASPAGQWAWAVPMDAEALLLGWRALLAINQTPEYQLLPRPLNHVTV